MKRHAFDPLSFIFGIAFVLLAGGLTLAGIEIEDPGILRWLGAGLLLLLGTVMLFTSRSSTDRDER
jgi:hypothetical protein